MLLERRKRVVWNPVTQQNEAAPAGGLMSPGTLPGDLFRERQHQTQVGLTSRVEAANPHSGFGERSTSPEVVAGTRRLRNAAAQEGLYGEQIGLETGEVQGERRLLPAREKLAGAGLALGAGEATRANLYGEAVAPSKTAADIAGFTAAGAEAGPRARAQTGLIGSQSKLLRGQSAYYRGTGAGAAKQGAGMEKTGQAAIMSAEAQKVAADAEAQSAGDRVAQSVFIREHLQKHPEMMPQLLGFLTPEDRQAMADVMRRTEAAGILATAENLEPESRAGLLSEVTGREEPYPEQGAIPWVARTLWGGGQGRVKPPARPVAAPPGVPSRSPLMAGAGGVPAPAAKPAAGKAGAVRAVPELLQEFKRAFRANPQDPTLRRLAQALGPDY